MSARVTAWILIVLAAAPFTAPFSTCDLATLFGHATHQTNAGNDAAPIVASDDREQSANPHAVAIGPRQQLQIPTGALSFNTLTRGGLPRQHAPRLVVLRL
jgi:hypothetical protein